MTKVLAGCIGVFLTLVVGIAMFVSSTEEVIPHWNTLSQQLYECDVSAGLTNQYMSDAGLLQRAQRYNARDVYRAGAERGIPREGIVVAFVTAFQESQFKNYANENVPESLELDHDDVGTDHDSVGVFQQRVSMDWGPIEDLMDPYASANLFYDALMELNDWKTMSPYVAAQKVQKSAYPRAYKKHESKAETLVLKLSQHTDCESTTDISVSEAGWTNPLPDGDVGSGFRTSDRPNHDGIDIMARHGTPIVAASSGKVITVVCNASLNGQPYSCNTDGSPSVAGCGWYAEILHPNGYVTRYCHMWKEPQVEVGQTVQVGQQIGEVGSSGNSSGPHLHFELHTDDPATPGNAVAPRHALEAYGVTL
ncbi:M23 family metallopeptidase [Haloglycomyces albus]|uniref:M23 family metallopeptidase n=1 Tax=Haloglycomyces albus TaxID=526067 RepID=UPI00046CCD4A|nr:M23 family metallopeptidase [Haloglycomyces albus]